MRRVLGLLALLSILGLAIPPLFAVREKQRREQDGVEPFDESANDIDIAAIFDNLEVESVAPAFRGGDVLTWYGGGTLDLRGATLDPAGAELRMRAIFGGLQLVVPESWPVEFTSRSIFGGIADSRDPSREDPTLPTLTVDAQAIFGGGAIVARPIDELGVVPAGR
jgi:predicted membrane protein